MTSRILTMTSVGALVASMALVGCDQREQTNAKNATNDAVASANQKARELGNDASKGMERAKEATRDAAQDAKAAGDKIGDKIADAVITTSVKAELAKDPDLSALKINVDTENGRVALRGTAPSTNARKHASVLAQAVKGVVSVDNQLTVESGKS